MKYENKVFRIEKEFNRPVSMMTIKKINHGYVGSLKASQRFFNPVL
jgi:hypothetical protein